MDEIKMPCSHGYRSPAEYLKVASEHFFDKCINVFGRTSEEILNALNFYDKMQPWSGNTVKQEQIKMTKEDAVKLVAKTYGVPVAAMSGGNIVDALEALGLLKFDDPNLEPVQWTRMSDGFKLNFKAGYDPNTAAPVWKRETYSRVQSEFLTIHVGNHSHDIALETILNALKAKGLRVYGPEHGKEL